MNYPKLFLKVFTLLVLISGISFNTQAQNKKEIARNQSEKGISQSDKTVSQNNAELRLSYDKKLAEYRRLKIYLAEENEVFRILKELKAEMSESGLLLQKFDLEESESQGFIYAQPVKIEGTANFSELNEFFDKVAKHLILVSVQDFTIRQLAEQKADKTLNAEFILTVYYSKEDELLTKLPSFSNSFEEQRELEKRIKILDYSISDLKDLQTNQKGSNATLEAINERIAMTSGVYLKRIVQKDKSLLIEGNAPDEKTVTQFSRSLEFTDGVFSDLNIETVRGRDSTVNFAIKCAYNPSKAVKK